MAVPRTHASQSPSPAGAKRRTPSRTVTFADADSPSQAIRKKIESELARKRTISTTQHGGRKRGNKANVQKGTVAALKPSPALTVPETITVSEASQLCAAKRTDCVLVVDDDEGLSGIFTAKDLAYKVGRDILCRIARVFDSYVLRLRRRDWTPISPPSVLS